MTSAMGGDQVRQRNRARAERELARVPVQADLDRPGFGNNSGGTLRRSCRFGSLVIQYDERVRAPRACEEVITLLAARRAGRSRLRELTPTPARGWERFPRLTSAVKDNRLVTWPEYR